MLVLLIGKWPRKNLWVQPTTTSFPLDLPKPHFLSIRYPWTPPNRLSSPSKHPPSGHLFSPVDPFPSWSTLLSLLKALPWSPSQAFSTIWFYLIFLVWFPLLQSSMVLILLPNTSPIVSSYFGTVSSYFVSSNVIWFPLLQLAIWSTSCSQTSPKAFLFFQWFEFFFC